MDKLCIFIVIASLFTKAAESYFITVSDIKVSFLLLSLSNQPIIVLINRNVKNVMLFRWTLMLKNVFLIE